MTRQMQRLRDDATARGDQVVMDVTAMASILPQYCLNDERPHRKKLLTDGRVGVLVVEHKDRLTPLGHGYIATLLEHEGRRVEAVYPPRRAMAWETMAWETISRPSSRAWPRVSMAARLHGRASPWPRASMAARLHGRAPPWPTQRQVTRRTDPGMRQRRMCQMGHLRTGSVLAHGTLAQRQLPPYSPSMTTAHQIGALFSRTR
jgi:hypothetical protein